MSGPQQALTQQEQVKLIEVQNDHIDDLARSQEPRFISVILKNKDLLQDCISKGISKDCFREEVCKQLFILIAGHYNNYKALLTRQAFADVVMSLWKTPEEHAFWRSKYDSIYSTIADKDEYSSLLDGLEARFVQKQAYSILQHYFAPILNSTTGQKELIQKFQRSVGDICSPDQFSVIKGTSLADSLKDEVWQEILDRKDHPERYVGLRSGFQCMDLAYNGFLEGKYIVVLAMENGGKTTFMLNMARNMVVDQGLTVAYVTIESDAATITKRIMTLDTGVNYNRIHRGGNDEHSGLGETTMGQLSEFNQKFNSEMGEKFHIIEALQGTPRSVIEHQLDQIRAYTHIDVVFVDYLEVIGADVSYPNRPDLELADVSAGFQNYGKKCNTLVVTAQQLRGEKVRELNKTGKKVDPENFDVNVGDVAGSKKISGAADMMFALLLDKQTRSRLYIKNMKARNNRAAERFVLQYDEDSGRLIDLPTDPTGFEQIANNAMMNVAFQEEAFSHVDQVLQELPVQSAVQYITTGATTETCGEHVFSEWEPAQEGNFFGL